MQSKLPLPAQVLRNAKKRSMYDSVSDDGVPGKSGRAPPWTPSGGDPHFDAWLRRWMRDNGHVHLTDTHLHRFHKHSWPFEKRSPEGSSLAVRSLH